MNILPTDSNDHEYENSYRAEILERIRIIKRKYGNKILIAAHYYQRKDILALADIVGDSLQLSQMAATNHEAVALFFCGVHFMAETADILMNNPDEMYRRRQRGEGRCDVILPDLRAGCSMAEMATAAELEECWKQLSNVLDMDRTIPVTYVNSLAEVKAFCGRHGGAACTSSNADKVLDWALSQGDRVLFLPDRHLGYNTARKKGIPEEQIVLWNHSNQTLLTESENLGLAYSWDSSLPGGITPDLLIKSRIILWNGFCSVHQRFRASDIDRVRKTHSGISVIVHPECNRDVVEKSDEAGSTAKILRLIKESQPGAAWAVGTETRMVERLIRDFSPDRTIVNLSEVQQYCPSMDRINLKNLCNVMENWDKGTPVPIIKVDPQTASDAVCCLQRMIENCQ